MEKIKTSSAVRYKPRWYDGEIEKHKTSIGKLLKAIKEEKENGGDMLLIGKYEEQLSFIRKSVANEVKEWGKNYFDNLIIGN